MILRDFFTEAANPAQQAAIAIAMKKAHKKPRTEGAAEGLNEFAPGGNSASSYYAVTANFVNEFAQQKQEELQDLIDSGWTKQDLAQAGTLQSHASDIAHFEQVRDGFLKGLKPGFDAYLRGDTQLKDQLGSYWQENDLPLDQDWQKIYGDPWGRDEYDEGVAEACWPGYHKDGMKTMFGKRYPNCIKNKKKNEDTIQEFVEETLGQKNSDEIRRIQQMLNKKFGANLDVDGVLGPLTKQSIQKFLPGADTAPAPKPERTTAVQGLEKKSVAEQQCPECGGPIFSELMINEKQDACYYKVKSRYKVWPSAYASGALVQCRKKGAANWGNKSKK